MKFPNKYKILNKNKFEKNRYSIIPIRFEDRFEIMEWRNEQMFHLRQSERLTIESQNTYFSEVISKLFRQNNPNQLLFSYLKDDILIGYGGLVHMNWIDKNAEISFLLNPTSNKEDFQEHWVKYLSLIEEVAFNQLKFHKIYTYAFDLRPQLYQALESVGFTKEAVLKEHCFFNNTFIDVVIHEKRRKQNTLKLRKANADDIMLIFNWANDPLTRKMSFHTDEISLKTHTKWFYNHLEDNNVYLLVVEIEENDELRPIGQVKFDKEGVIGISLDKKYRGKGLGVQLIEEGLNYIKSNTNFEKIIAFIKSNNTGSIAIFEKAGFIKSEAPSINNEECFKYICSIN